MLTFQATENNDYDYVDLQTMNNNMGEKHIIIIGGRYAFPSGTGATVRVYGWAKGFLHAGCTTEIICLNATNKKSLENPENEGIYDGVPYKYCCGTSVWKPGLWSKISRKASSLWYVLKSNKNIYRDKEVIVLTYGGESLYDLILALILTHRLKAFLVADVTEKPFVYVPNTYVTRTKEWLIGRIIAKKIRIISVITYYLKEYYSNYGILENNIVIIPAFSYRPRYLPSENRKDTVPTIAYCGNLMRYEELSRVIEIFNGVKREIHGCRLLLIGPKENEILDQALGIEHDDIELTGIVPQDQIINVLERAWVNILPRKDADYSRAGFPTKLVDYMFSSRPSVVSSTGDISRYIKSGESIILVSPDAPTERYVQEIVFLLENSERAREMGIRAFNTACESFHADNAAYKILEHIK